jgi:hypothetical protein
MYGDSATFYGQQRSRRRRLSYQAYLAGGVDEVIAAEVAASASSSSTAMRAIGIGVATGVLTLLVNRWLERLLK